MDWQNSTNAQGWFPANYSNMPYGAPYGQPPPTIGNPWGPYGNYPAYPQSQWGYAVTPNYNVPPPPFQSTTSTNADKKPPINPPLPPDPPPAEPSKPEEATAAKELSDVSSKIPKETPQVHPSKENYFATKYSYPYPPMNWCQSNQQTATQATEPSDSQLLASSIKFNLNGKKILPTSTVEGSKPSNIAASATVNYTSASNASNKAMGKFSQLNFTKGQNLSIDSKVNSNEIISKSASDVKKSVTVPLAGDWPESLKRYVGKCFSRCQTELDKDQVEICLKGKLTQSAHSGSLWGKDWDKEALINVYSHAIESPNKANQSDADDLFQSDLSRGFILKKRTPQKSSPTDMRSEKRHLSDDDNFLPFNKRGRLGNKKRGKNRKNLMNNINQNNPFYSKMGAKNDFESEKEFGSSEMMQKRAARFAPGDMPQTKKNWKQNNRLGPKKKMNLMASLNVAFSSEENIDWEAMHIIGTSTTVEKQFLRLTAAPDPCTVRTPATLKRSLEIMKKKWVELHDYRYTCNQLKSIRQDLTVQGLRNKFTIKVYETHCRVALEEGDHEEFNQCQSQLKQLYAEIGGDNVMEFTAYRLLYYIFTKNTLDITSLLAKLSDKDKTNECVSFALKVRAAWSLSNYYRFFCLYKKAPLMSGFLMDWFSERERKNAIKIIIKGYRPGAVTVAFVRSCLAFDSDDDWTKFVELCSIKFTNDTKQLIDCKNTVLTV